jgi:hypothetical protein
MKKTVRVVTHPAFKAAYASLEDFLSNAFSENGQARCALLSGPPRCGKTTIAELIVNHVLSRPPPPRKGDLTMQRQRCVYVETPAAATQKSLGETILIAAKDPVIGRLSQAQLLNRVAGLLKDLDTELMVLDDFHHLITTGRRAHAAEVAEFVKTFLNVGVCPILLVGVDPVSDIMTSNGQLEGRCWCRPTLEPFGWESKAEQALFSRLLRQLVSMLTIQPAFDVGDLDFAERMHLASGGAIGIVTLLNEKAVARASRNQLSVMTLDTFAEAYADWDCKTTG